tara:strand:+ start:1611 stop:1859 length:249 start_codon:yes stop_codon:yes gene_type:complete
MTMKSTRFFIVHRQPEKKILKGYRKEIYFQMEDVQFFNKYKYSDNLIDVSFYNGNRILLEHNFQDFLIQYERTRQSNYLNLN